MPEGNLGRLNAGFKKGFVLVRISREPDGLPAGHIETFRHDDASETAAARFRRERTRDIRTLLDESRRMADGDGLTGPVIYLDKVEWRADWGQPPALLMGRGGSA